MAGLQTNVYAAAIITWTAALVALILRVIARRLTNQRWWVDDYFCVSAFVSLSTYFLTNAKAYPLEIFATSYNILIIICKSQTSSPFRPC